MAEPNPSQGEFTVPFPPRYGKRIPDGLPFAVRPSMAKSAVIGVAIGLLSSCAIGANVILRLTDGPTSPTTVVVGVTILVVVVAGICTLLAATMAAGGPLLACDHNGIWVRVRQFPAKAIFLPWHAVRTVYKRKFLFQTMVCVSPHDPTVGRGHGALAGMERFQQTLLTGSRFATATLHADTKADPIMAAIAHFSQGRCHIAPW